MPEYNPANVRLIKNKANPLNGQLIEHIFNFKVMIIPFSPMSRTSYYDSIIKILLQIIAWGTFRELATVPLYSSY